jgi:hypothetical protein
MAGGDQKTTNRLISAEANTISAKETAAPS